MFWLLHHTQLQLIYSYCTLYHWTHFFFHLSCLLYLEMLAKWKWLYFTAFVQFRVIFISNRLFKKSLKLNKCVVNFVTNENMCNNSAQPQHTIKQRRKKRTRCTCQYTALSPSQFVNLDERRNGGEKKISKPKQSSAHQNEEY